MIIRNDILAFTNYHPISLFSYFLTIIFFSMFTTNPILLCISLVGSFIYLISIAKNTWRIFLYYLVIFLLITLTNPLFVHNGETILFFMNDKPVTLEAIVYGAVIALMIISVVYWFKGYNEAMTSDKFIFLFGNIIPKIALTISMILRYVPLFIEQSKKIKMTQKTLGLYASDSYSDKLMSSLRIFRSLIGWSLENSVDVARSMRSRGYGLKKRTHYVLYRFYKEDIILLIITAIFWILIFFMVRQKIVSFTYYPTIDTLEFSIKNMILYILVGFYVLVPTLIELKEQLLWRLLISKI